MGVEGGQEGHRQANGRPKAHHVPRTKSPAFWRNVVVLLSSRYRGLREGLEWLPPMDSRSSSFHLHPFITLQLHLDGQPAFVNRQNVAKPGDDVTALAPNELRPELIALYP